MAITINPNDTVATSLAKLQAAVNMLLAAAPTPVAALASITSPATLSQPAATQRFFAATADRPGTWSLGSTGNASDFTIDSVTGIYSVKASAAGDGSAQLVKTLPIAFTPYDGTMPVGKTVTVTLGTIAAPASTSQSFTADLTGASQNPPVTYPANKPLESVTGFTSILSHGVSDLVLDGNGTITSTGGANGPYSVIVTPPTVSKLRAKFTILGSSSFPHAHLLFGSDDGYNNGVVVSVLAQTGAIYTDDGFYLRQGGPANNTKIAGSSGGANTRADGTVDVVGTFSADGNTLTVEFFGGGATPYSVQTIDMTGKTKGPAFALTAMGGDRALDTGGYVKEVSWSIKQMALAVTTVPVSVSGNTATYGLTWDTTLARPTFLQHRLYSPTGAAVTDWITGDTTVNDNGTISYSGTAPGAALLTASFRALNDIGVTATAASATRFLYTPHAFEVGYGVTGPAYAYPYTPLNDWGKTATIQSGQVYVQYNGITTKSGQVDTVTTDVGVTLATTGNHPTLQVLTTNPTTGVHTVRVTGDATDTGQRSFGIASATNGITFFSVARGGVTGKIAPEWITGMEGTGWRTLDVSGTNILPVRLNQVTDKIYQSHSTGCDLPYQDIIDAHAAKMAVNPEFKRLWHPFNVNCTDAYVTAFATYARDQLPQTAEIAFTLNNEDWNVIFPGQLLQQIYAMQAGYWGGATYGNLQPTKTILTITGASGGLQGSNQGYAGSGAANNTDGPAASAGDWVFYNLAGAGYSIYEAKANLPVGTAIGDNANWRNRPEVYSTRSDAAWVSSRHNQMIEIFRSVFGQGRFQQQIAPVVDGWVARPDLANYFADRINFVPGYWDKVKGLGLGFYNGPDDSWAASASPTIASFDASARSHSTAVIRPAMLQAVRECVNMGKAPYFYEGGSFEFNTAALDTAHSQVFQSYLNSSAIQSFYQEQASWLKANIPGVIMFYLMGGTLPYALKPTWNDTANPRYLGWKAGLAS